MISRNIKQYFEVVPPIKITEAARLKLKVKSWSVLSDYHLESVKINYSESHIESTAVVRVGDVSGHVVCIIKGRSVGLLFGLSKQEWKNIEASSKCCDQLFYRYFKDGMKKSFSTEQKLFYNFCAVSQTNNILIAVFQRCVNMRNKDKDDACIQVYELLPADITILDIYQDYLTKNS